MPNRMTLEDGPDDAMVRLNVRIPRGLKRSIAEMLAMRGKNLNDWVRDALRERLLREQREVAVVRPRNGPTRRRRAP